MRMLYKIYCFTVPATLLGIYQAIEKTQNHCWGGCPRVPDDQVWIFAWYIPAIIFLFGVFIPMLYPRFDKWLMI